MPKIVLYDDEENERLILTESDALSDEMLARLRFAWDNARTLDV